MKIRRQASILLLLPFFTPLAFQAQTLHSFQQDDTLQRKALLKETQLKKDVAINGAEKNYSEDYKKIYSEQFSGIERFWSSSRPVTDKAAYDYLQKLVARLTQADPSLKDLDLRVVFSRDWWPNAVSMGDGTLVLNAGLLIYLGSEAELAFVLGHEIAHYHLNHNHEEIRRRVELINSDTIKNEVKRINTLEYGMYNEIRKLTKSLVFDFSKHSRDNESEADAFSMDLMIKSGYNVESARQTLEMLDRVDDTLYADPISASVERIFNQPEFPFRKRWIQKESMIFGEMKNEVDDEKLKKEIDSLKTHPDCQVRIKQLIPLMEKAGSVGNNYLVDSAYFHQLRLDLYYEMMEQCYKYELLGRNLFYALLLLGKESENTTAVLTIARAWNDIYYYQKEHKLGLFVEPEDRHYHPSYNDLLRMISRIKLDEILALNTAFCKKYYEQMKDIPAFKAEVKRIYEFKKL